ncbi:uncharacterized protein LOC129778813 isoform X2 [Toxorhynchites rutilus septentrionalis]|uniref:uncharacterized protein LOC129778813 isoform X2 n=1 Tax=Toxorhynchites rutilus septentrionalis TaxID=329112 RepID=UPI00247A2449|nr:uncharacterized protein LOC129778813 isoform X2 [Toxorhynchites rutilus septentrionalis]
MEISSVETDMGLPDYCRLCLAENVQMVVPKEPKVFQQLSTKLKDCLLLWITVSELSESVICKKCYETLERLHQFRLRCHRYNNYLALRKSLDPDRKHPLRYGENWYWYSCQGNNAKCVYWGCSVVCCPAYIIAHPSGKVSTGDVQHQHKQKLEDVKNVYCNGEYVYDGYRFSFDLMNPNRTLAFSCRSLNDPFRKCTATLTTNDKSEVMSSTDHNHPRELIIESAAKCGKTGDKQTITLIRGKQRELALCQGFWYETSGGQDSVFHWECIRYDCACFITMKNGVLEYYGKHGHGAVWLKWGADASKATDAKSAMLMKIINPSRPPLSSLYSGSTPVTQVTQPQASNSAIRPISARTSTELQQVFRTDVTHAGSNVSIAAVTAPTMLPKDEIEAEQTTLSSPNALPPFVTRIKTEPQDSSIGTQSIVPIAPHSTTRIIQQPYNMVRPPAPLGAGMVNKRLRTVRKVVTIRPTHPTLPTIVVRQPIDVEASDPSAKSPRVYHPRQKLQKSATPSSAAVPKILHVMSLSKTSNQPKAKAMISHPAVTKPIITRAKRVDGPEPLLLTAIKAEPGQSDEDAEAETITDDLSSPVSTAGRDTITRDESSTGVTKHTDNSFKATSSIESETASTSSQNTISAEEVDDDVLCDLQDDGDIPPIVPIDDDLKGTGKSPIKTAAKNKPQSSLKKNDPQDSANRSAMLKKIVNLHRNATPSPSHVTRGMNNDGNESVVKTYSRQSFGPESNASNKMLLNSGNKRKERDSQIQSQPVKKLKADLGSPNAIDPDVVKLPSHAIGSVEQQEDESAAEMSTNDLSESCPMEDPIAVPTEPYENVHSVVENPIKTAESLEPTQSTSSNAKLLPADRNPKENNNRFAEKVTSSKTVQVVKLQKSEQMLNFEGHLYKINWCNRRFSYWECMLRQQVHCMAILETQDNDSRSWIKYGSHNHKVPKPIVNDDSGGKYQMFNASSGIAQVKRPPQQTLSIEDIVEQEGKMMSLRRRKLANFSIYRDNTKLTLMFGNFTYQIVWLSDPGFIWKCTSCSAMLETDEKFTIARETGDPHNHALNPTVIDLDNEDSGVKATGGNENKTTSVVDIPERTEPPPVAVEDENKVDSSKDNEEESDALVDQQEIVQAPIVGTDELSDEEEVVLDPLSGEFLTKGEMKRKENRAKLDDAGNEDDEDDVILDPLTGQFRRKGDPKLLEMTPAEQDQEQEEEYDQNTDESKQTVDTEDLPNEDFEELLRGDSGGHSGGKITKMVRNSLAALKLELSIHNKLKDEDCDRNFEVLPHTDGTCLIRYNEFTYQLDAAQSGFSVWKCWLSPQYACRGKIHLNADCKETTVSGVNHCHASTIKDMFVNLPEREEGDILDGDLGTNRKYTFFKRPNNLYYLQLEDGFIYSCLTMSKTTVSSWRCASRKNHNCKAIVTMEGEFNSLTRNRFSHSHDPPSTLDDLEGEKKDAPSESNVDSTHSKKKKMKSKVEEKKKRKRQTL